MTPREVLIAARELISVPERWTQGCSARDRNGLSDTPGSDTARKWCAAGALGRVCDSDALYQSARRMLERALPDARPIAAFNDSESHGAVIAVFDRAIAAAGEP